LLIQRSPIIIYETTVDCCAYAIERHDTSVAEERIEEEPHDPSDSVLSKEIKRIVYSNEMFD